MKKTRKLIALMLAVLMIAGMLAGCGGSAGTPTNPPSNNTENPAPASDSGNEPAAVTQDPVNIVCVSHFTEDYLSYQGMHDGCEKITAATNGAVTFEYYPLEQMVKAAEEWDAVSTGLADMAPLFPGNSTGIEPMLGAGDLPFEYEDWQHFLRAWNGGQRAIMEEVFAEHNLKLLNVVVPYINGTMIFTQKEVKSPADMAGLRIRTSSVAAANIVTTCGASTVSMSSSEYYLALSTHTIDGVTTSPIPGLERSVQEVITNILDVNMSIPYDFLAINMDTWNKLTPETQALFEETFGEDYFMDVISGAEAADKECREIYANAGVSFYQPTADEAAEWQDIGASTYGDFISSVGQRGEDWLAITEATRNG